jgi:hypothetical protein
MNGFVCFGAAYFLNSLWQAPLFGGMGWLASRMLKRLGPQAQHAAWVATLGLMILIPGLLHSGPETTHPSHPAVGLYSAHPPFVLQMTHVMLLTKLN